jgi:hypothetical protein
LTEFLPECLAEDELGVDGVVVPTHLLPGRLLTARQELAQWYKNRFMKKFRVQILIDDRTQDISDMAGGKYFC